MELDTVLSWATIIAWGLFAVYIASLFGLTSWYQGIRPAAIRLISDRVLLLLLPVVSTTLLSAALVFILPHEVGVVVSVVSPDGVHPRPLRAGLHWIIPFLENAVRYPASWQTYTTSSTASNEGQTGANLIRAQTSDGQEIALNASVIFRIEKEEAVLFHINWQDRYLEGFVRPTVHGIVAAQVSQFTLREIISAVRRDLGFVIERSISASFAENGLVLGSFLLHDIIVSTDALKILQEEDQLRREAEQMRNVASGKADAILMKTQAEVRSLEAVAEVLKKNPDLLTYQYIEKLSPNLRAIIVPSNAPLLLPLANSLADLD